MSTTMSKYGASINRPLSEIVGLSTDVKPTDKVEGIPIQNGSIFIEMDTNKKYRFDIESRQWNLVDSGGGGGGGGGSATLIEKTITANGEYNASDDGADGYKKVEINVVPPSNEFYPTIRTQRLMIQNEISSVWAFYSWSGFNDISGSNVWTDGENIYYGSGDSQYYLPVTKKSFPKVAVNPE